MQKEQIAELLARFEALAHEKQGVEYWLAHGGDIVKSCGQQSVNIKRRSP